MHPSNVDYYRIIDADYVFVGLKRDLGCLAHDVADSSRRKGLRVGLVMLETSAPIPDEVAYLIAQAKAVGVVESAWTGNQIAPALVAVLRKAAEEEDWHAPGRIPRIYSAELSLGSMAPPEEDLIALARAMHVYEPKPLVRTSDGLAKPARSAPRTEELSAVA
jgi:pyruvate/2-oxoacid:ferredoxin oxidoreductase alpha subunit